MIQLFRIALLSKNVKLINLFAFLVLTIISLIGEVTIFGKAALGLSQNAPQSSLVQAQVATATTTPTSSPTQTTFPTPTAMPTLQATNTSVPLSWDIYEPNNSFDTPYSLTVNQTLQDASISPANDIDYYEVYAKQGQILNLQTFVGSGVDTKITLYSSGGNILAQNDDRSPTDLGSSIIWNTQSDGWLILSIESAVPGYGGKYSLAVLLESPTPTSPPPPTSPAPTGVPTITPTPPAVAADQYEPNNSTDGAVEIIVGTSYQGTLPKGDVDYYTMLTKGGNKYECDTKASGVDTAISVFNSGLGVIVENDDRSPQDVGSYVTWRANQTEMVYIAIQNRTGSGNYSLLCNVPAPPAPSGNPGSGSSISQPENSTETSTPYPTPTPAMLVRFLGETKPTATPEVMTTVRLVIAYDKNDNRSGDIGEGIQNISVRAIYGGRIVGWGLTDERGEVVISITGNVERVTIPYLNSWEMRVRPGDDVGPRTVLIPAVPLPVLLPVETPVPIGEEDK